MTGLPAWLRNYQKSWLAGDATAGLIVTVMLIPQSLAYAMLAGLPPQYGMYASILPLIAYAAFGTSMALAVGPVAVASLMTANALTPLAAQGSPEYIALSIALAAISGVMLFIFGLLRLGALANLLSHPVIAGFITGSAILISIGQLKPLLGLNFKAHGALEQAWGLITHLANTNMATAALGILSVLALWSARKLLKGTVARLAPMAVVVLSTVLVAMLHLDTTAGVKIVGHVPAGLPALQLPVPSVGQLQALWLPALLISLIGMVESISVARSLASKKKQRIEANKEFLGLGAANLASAFSGGYPVTGGFARSVVNFAAGANTPLAGVISAVLMAVVLLGMTSWFYYLPQAVLAATIIVAVTSLVDFSVLKHAWRFDKADAVAFLVTMLGVLVLGVEEGIVLGVVLSLAAMVYKTSHPHIAVVGRVPGTEHFRNVERHDVQTQEHLLALRIDENVYFGNAAVIEQRIQDECGKQNGLQHLLLILSAVNRIDTTGLEMLEDLLESLEARGIRLSLAEVKGPVMDALARTELPQHMKHPPFLSTHQAFEFLRV